ncbi:hypothetical protein DFJ74DRAFT_655214 [Hyaloraphidium curvatum]|nr:hypothetical protein DFJ74DRAFT_655214 [Hyaloraphidium curvatum]
MAAPAAPRAMPAPVKNLVRPVDSPSLWNYSLSPGWTDGEAEVFRRALMRFGIGQWKDIIESGCLPGKTNAQMNIQLQRMLGQQSVAEFQGLHIDPLVIGRINAAKQGPEITRKNGFIVNTGAKLSREEVRRRMKENKEKHELPEDEWKAIELPQVSLNPELADVKLLELKSAELRDLQAQLAEVRGKIAARVSQLRHGGGG